MRVLGLISGTSVDAVEAALVDFRSRGDVLECDLVAQKSVPYPDRLRRRILAVLPPAETTIDEVCRLDTEIGQFFAEVAFAIAEQDNDALQLVSSHGQTVFHWVDGGRALGTLQLGQPAWIAERTGASVVSDLRSRDIAAGGHGAPLVSVLDALLLQPGPGIVRGALNLGGISNVTRLEDGSDPLAFDIGPANALIDAAVAQISNGEEACDLDGERARRGRVDARLLESLLDDPYYAIAPPKSTGKELFNFDYLLRALDNRHLEPDDLVATVTRLTVETVARALNQLGASEVVVAGGGTRNPVVMEDLRASLPGVRFSSIEEFGVPAAAKEAVAFALIGYLTACGLPAALPSCTGAAHPSVLGSLTPGSRPLKTPGDVTMPRRLLVRALVN